MTEYGYQTFPEEDSLASFSSSEQEDEPTVAWVDQTLDEAETNGTLHVLAERVEDEQFVDPTEYQARLEQAMAQGAFDADRPDAIPAVAPNATSWREDLRPAAPPGRRPVAPRGTRADRPPGSRSTRARTPAPGRGARARRTRTPTRGPRATTTVPRSTTRRERGRRGSGAGCEWPGHRRRLGLGDRRRDGLPAAVRRVRQPMADPRRRAVPEGAARELARPAGRRIQAPGDPPHDAVAGMPVRGARLVELSYGYIQEITDESGHYRPDAVQQFTALSALLDQGISLEEARVRLTGSTMGYRPTDKAGWINSASAEPGLPERDAFRPDHFLQTGGGEYQSRPSPGAPRADARLGERPGTQIHDSPASTRTSPSPSPRTTTSSRSTTAIVGLRVNDPNQSGYQMVVPADQPGNDVVLGGLHPRRGRSAYALDSVPVPPATRSSCRSRTPSSPPSPRTMTRSSTTTVDAVARFPYPYRSAYSTLVPADAPSSDPSVSEDGTRTPRTSRASPRVGGRRQRRRGPRAEFLAGRAHTSPVPVVPGSPTWFRTLGQDHQDLLLADPQIAAACRPRRRRRRLAPAEADLAAAATTNAAFVDSPTIGTARPSPSPGSRCSSATRTPSSTSSTSTGRGHHDRVADRAQAGLGRGTGT